MQSPSQVHFGACKLFLRYLQGTEEFGIWHAPATIDDMKSTSGYAFIFRSGVFSWASKKQATVAQLATEAKYVAAAESSSQAIWLRKMLNDMGDQQTEPTTIFCDNKSAIAIAKNLLHNNRTKHIAIKYHFIS